jgi:hypothetical protein
MTLESLLLSQDPELVRVLRPTLEELSIDVEVCHEARAGADMLIADKFDAISPAVWLCYKLSGILPATRVRWPSRS